MIIDSYIGKEELKQQQAKVIIYNNAYLTSVFVGHILGGKKIPDYSEIFKDEPKVQTDEAIEDSLLADRMRDFARNANKQLKK